ncbi:Ku protein [Parvularcula flava]|uniref:Non-homologous end joining protein Ku n=1 Tax=Aquisalinus luteolus TaxID=1566827 RepID=A0A8J3A1U6_9PROT|nr:Ku protein [Aquisalinus luteolus]NHK27881.1 Ku protein [Aquisalinus luteolus]GGH96789.1 non-homologous end joining protein Ku [Aquisalinus luteolus]
MAARAYWKGYLKLSLVSIGIELFSATKSAARPSLNQIHEPSGKRVRYQKIVEGVGPIDTDEIVKGYQVSKDNYVILSNEELDEIRLETKETIELVQFVDHCEIDPRYFEKPYYVVPKDDISNEGFIVIREALRDAKKVALGQMAVRGRDYVVAIKPCGDGLLLETLRYAEEIKQSDGIFDDIPDMKLDKELLELAGELIEKKSKPFNAENFEAQYATALRELIKEKEKKGKVSHDDSESSTKSESNVIDLMDALKKSVSGSKSSSKKSTKKTTKKSTKKKAS